MSFDMSEEEVIVEGRCANFLLYWVSIMYHHMILFLSVATGDVVTLAVIPAVRRSVVPWHISRASSNMTYFLQEMLFHSSDVLLSSEVSSEEDGWKVNQYSSRMYHHYVFL